MVYIYIHIYVTFVGSPAAAQSRLAAVRFSAAPRPDRTAPPRAGPAPLWSHCTTSCYSIVYYKCNYHIILYHIRLYYIGSRGSCAGASRRSWARRVYIYIYICIYIYILYTCNCVYVYIYIYTFTHIVLKHGTGHGRVGVTYIYIYIHNMSIVKY